MTSFLNFDSDTAFFDDALKQLDSLNSKASYEADPDDWYPGVDKSGNGLAVVRIMPPLENEKVPMVKWYSHNFKNPDNDRWYIENSLKSISEETPDPVAEYNKKLWNSTKDDDHPNRKQARRQKRTVNYRVNVYIVSDSANPENNGKIKKWRFGKTFYDLINLAMHPPKIEGAEEEEKPLNPFDLVRGADLKIQIYSERKGGELRRNYSKSGFKDRAPIFKDKDRIIELYKLYQSEPSRWSLAAYRAPDKFKDYDTLLKRLNYVMEIDTKTGKRLDATSNASNKSEDSIPEQAPKSQRRTELSGGDEEFNFDGFMNQDDD